MYPSSLTWTSQFSIDLAQTNRDKRASTSASVFYSSHVIIILVQAAINLFRSYALIKFMEKVLCIVRQKLFSQRHGYEI